MDCSKTERHFRGSIKMNHKVLHPTRKSSKDKNKDFLVLKTVEEESQTSVDADSKDKEKERLKVSKNKEHFHRGKVKILALRNIGHLRRGKSLDTCKDGIERTRESKDIKRFNSKSVEEVDDAEDYTVVLNEEDYVSHHQDTRRPAICEEIERIVEMNNGTPLRTQRRNLIVSDNLLKWHLL